MIPPGATLVVNEAVQTQTQIIASLQAILTKLQAVRDARAALQQELQALKTDRPSEHEFLMQLHAALVAFFGRKSPQLAQFGFTPAKQRQAKSADKTAAAARATVTREIRHTMGKRQKQQHKAAATPDVTISNGKVNIAFPAAPATEASPATPNGAAPEAQGTESGNGSSKP